MTKKILNVPHYDQTNNDSGHHGPGWRQCNLTSHAMALDFLTDGDLKSGAARNGMREPESYYGFHLAKYGDTIDHGAHTRCLKEVFKLDTTWKKNGSLADLRSQLDKGKPVPIGVHYKHSGHIVCVVGYDDVKEFFYVNDPYGVRRGVTDQYISIGGGSGKQDIYSYNSMYQLFSSWYDDDGWMRVFH